MPVEALATPTQLRRYLQLEPDDVEVLPDDIAELALSGAAKACLSYMGFTGGQLTASEDEITVRVTGARACTILVPIAPITGVTSVIQDPDGLDGDPIDLTEYCDWDTDGIIELRGGLFPARRRYIEITFTGGYEEVPEDVRNTVLRIAARAFSNPESLVTESTGGYSAGFAFDDSRLATLSDADRMGLDPYRLG